MGGDLLVSVAVMLWLLGSWMMYMCRGNIVCLNMTAIKVVLVLKVLDSMK